MVDVLNQEQRRLNMSRIRGKDTKPEMLLRRSLHALGYRYQLHRRDLMGRPDLFFPMYKAVVFVHGCFWHGHDCHLFRMPATRPEFWAAKINRNVDRDQAVYEALLNDGWRVLTIWECAVRGVSKSPLSQVLEKIEGFLHSTCSSAQIMGTDDRAISVKALTITRAARSINSLARKD